MTAWLTEPPKWKAELLKLLLDGSKQPVPSPPLHELIERSRRFPIEFCTDSVKCETLQHSVEPAILQRNIDSVYPLMHESVLYLCAEFLACKRKHGSRVERKLYKGMHLLDFVQRLLAKKAVFFAGAHDFYRLLSGPEAAGGWEAVGTDDEEAPLVLAHWLSYDEMKLSALVSISSYSHFTNDGSRAACREPKASVSRDSIQPEGVVVSVIGARLHKVGCMEYQDMVISRTQNRVPCAEGTVRRLFTNFYGEKPRAHNEVEAAFKNSAPSTEGFFWKWWTSFYREKSPAHGKDESGATNGDKRFVQLWNNEYFDNAVFAKRLTVSFDTLLLEANHRAKLVGKVAYVYVVGIGLGVWRVSTHQPQVFADVFESRLGVLGAKLTHISDVHLAYIPYVESCGTYKDQDVVPVAGHATGIKVHISKGEPFVKLSDPDKLLVVSYAADANSLPGNEFWTGCAANSSDSATASSTQVSELHNPHINPMVSVGNLQVVTSAGPLLSIQDYVDRLKRPDSH